MIRCAPGRHIKVLKFSETGALEGRDRDGRQGICLETVAEKGHPEEVACKLASKDMQKLARE